MTLPRKTILVVEDDHQLRQLYRAYLVFGGFDVREARDGMAALAILDSYPPPDLVILDIGLPTVSGLVVQQEIAARAVMRHVPVVIVTGSTEDLSRVNVDCLLRKPVSADELVATVRKCLASGAPAA